MLAFCIPAVFSEKDFFLESIKEWKDERIEWTGDLNGVVVKTEREK